MAADMVASITLRLRDQMSAGIDEIKREFGSVQATLDKLTVVLGDLQGTLDALRMPGAINQSLKGTIGEADAAARAVSSIGAAAVKSAEEMRTMNGDLAIPAAPYAIHNPAIPPEFYNVPGAVPEAAHGAPSPSPTESPGAHPGDGLMDFIGASIMAAIGVDSIRTNAEYNNLNLHSAITERYSGARAKQQERWIGQDLDRLALKYRQSSNELAEAYYYLVTTHMKPALVDALMPMIAKTATAYNSSPQLMGAAAFAMSDSFKIPASQMEGALAAMAWAAKNSHFSIESMGEFLPMLGGMAATVGMTGRGNLDQIMAMVETIRKNVNQPQEAAHDLADLMQALSSIHTAEAFSQNLFKRALKTEQPLLEKYHIKPVDLWAVEQAGKAKGESPLMAVANYMHNLVAPMGKIDQSAFINAMFNGQQAGMAIKSMLLHWDEMTKLEAGLNKVNPALLTTDFDTAMQGSATDVRLFDESIKQVNRGIGNSLLPAFKAFTGALASAEMWLNPKLPDNLTASQRHGLLSNGAPSPFSATPAPGRDDGLMPGTSSQDHTDAMHHHAAALRDHADALRSGAHSGGSAPAGPMLNRP